MLVVGQRHGDHLAVCSTNVFSRVPSMSHTRTVLSPAAEDALAVGHRRHRATKLVCPQVLTRLLLATLHTLTSCRTTAGDVLAVGRH